MASANQPPQPPTPRASRVMRHAGVQAVTVSRWSGSPPAARRRLAGHCIPLERPASRVPGVSLRLFCHATPHEVNSKSPQMECQIGDISPCPMPHTLTETRRTAHSAQAITGTLWAGYATHNVQRTNIQPLTEALYPVEVERGTRNAINFILFQ